MNQTEGPTLAALPRSVIDLILEFLPEVIFAVVVTDADGVITEWNHFAERLYGWTRDEVIGRPISSVTTDPVRPDDLATIADRLGRGLPWTGTFTTSRRDGSTLLVDAAYFRVTGENGRDGVVRFSREDAEELESSLREHADLRQIAQRLDEVRYETARDIAGRLHDDLSQQCHQLLSQINGILDSPTLDDGVRRSAESLVADLRTLVASLQGIWRSLRPPLLDEFGVRAALEHLAEAAAHAGIERVDYAIDEEVDEVTGPIREVIVLIVQEALSNVTSHARARNCSLTVTREADSIVIEVTDDGVGYHHREGFGLRTMRERARRFGGFVQIGPGPLGTGTSLIVELELHWAQAAPLETLLDPHVILKAVRDDDGQVVDFVYTQANDAALAYNQTSRETLLGSHLLELLPGHRGSGLFAHYVHTVTTGQPLVLDDFVYPNEIVASDRRYDIRAVKVGDSLSYTWRDVTERHELMERYRMLAENASDVVLRTDADGVIEWVSPSIGRGLGWPPETVLGRSYRELIHPDDVGAVAFSASDDHRTRETRLRDADDRYHWYSLTDRRIADDRGATTRLVTLRNVDAELAARHALEDSRAEFQLLAENASDVVFRSNPTGIVEWVSPSVTRVLGWRPDELVGRHYSFTAHPDDVVPADRRDVAGSGGGSPMTFTLRALTREGEYRWFSLTTSEISDANGDVVAYIGSMHNVDDEFSALEALRASEDSQRHVAERAPDVIIECSLDGTVTWATPSVEAELGWSPTELAASPWLDLVAVGREDHARHFAEVAAEGDGRFHPRVTLRRAGGGTTDMSLRVKPNHDRHGRITSVTLGLRHVDDRPGNLQAEGADHRRSGAGAAEQRHPQ